MAVRSTALTRRGVGSLIGHILRDGSEPAELAMSAPPPGYPDDVRTVAALQRTGAPLMWIGSAAAALGLTGVATPSHAARVLRFGNGEEAPSRTNTAAYNTAAYGFVFSAPKTVSSILAHPNPAVQTALREALDRATAAAVAVLEASLTVRRGRGGHTTSTIDGLVGAYVVHLTSSAGDPHAHVHVIISARAPAEGTWLALDSRVLYAAQRIAEAAFQRTLRDELEARLGISDWVPIQIGPVPAWEIGPLMPAIERLSRARDRMRRIAAELGIGSLEGLTRDQDRLVWNIHRQQHAAELLEHALDAALMEGGKMAEAIRLEWLQMMGPARAILESIQIQPRQPQPRPTADQIVAALDTNRQVATMRAYTEAVAARTDAEKRLAAAMGWDEITEEKLKTLQTIAAKLAFFKSNNDHDAKLLELITNFQRARAQEIALETLIHTHATIRDRTKRLAMESDRPVIAADVVAHYVGAWGLPLAEARRAAAATITWWVENGLVATPRNLDVHTMARAVERGMVPDTRIQHAANGHIGRMVPTPLITAERRVDQLAASLARELRRAMIVDTDGLTDEQRRAAGLIAEGRGLVAIQGVAGAGKSHLMKNVVPAARERGMDVIVLGRNAKLATELATELGTRGYTLDYFCNVTIPNGRVTRPTLIILDEAGLVDQRHWLAILEYAQKNPNLQIVAIGDRLQIQPIDRRGSWGVVTAAAAREGAYTELTQTWRNRTWADEANALRNGDPEPVIAAAKGEGRLQLVPDPISEAAAIVLAARATRTDVLAITRTNAEAAWIADLVQKGLGITPDPRTHLRWDQQAGVGDIVRTRANSYSDPENTIRNGDTWFVRAITDTGILLEAARPGDRRSVWVSHDWARESLELAYAITADSAQGVTVDQAVVVNAGSMGRTMLYSAATRGRQAPVYLVAEELGPADVQLRMACRRDDIARTMREILDMDILQPDTDFDDDEEPPERNKGPDLELN